MRSSIMAVFAVTSLFAQSPVPQDPDCRKVEGRVLGTDGTAQRDVRVAGEWWFDHPVPRPGTESGVPLDERGEPQFGESFSIGADGKAQPRASWSGRICTDAEGRFRGAFRDWQREQFPMACFTADGRQGAVLEWSKADVPAHPEIRLQPTARVHARLKSSGLGLDAVDSIAYLNSARGTRLGMFQAEKGFDLRLPPGEYGLYLYGVDLASKTWPVTVPPGREDLDLGVLDLPAEYFALQRGKPLPEWHVTAARGVPLERSRIADFRGRWLLVEFWGFW